VSYAISSSALLAVTHLFLDACSGGLLLLLILLSMIIVALDYCRIIANSKGIIRVLLGYYYHCAYYYVVTTS